MDLNWVTTQLRPLLDPVLNEVLDAFYRTQSLM